jgi:predicted DNA-binding transcriptional regulator YafY
MATSQTKRVLELLKRFNDGKTICIETLQSDMDWWNDTRQEPMSEKSIRRDLDVIKEYFPDSYELIRGGKGEKGCYKAITKRVFDNILSQETMALIVQTVNIAQQNNMLERLNIDEDNKKILQKQIDKSKECYEFISKPYESQKGDAQLFKDLEKAIINKQTITVRYKSDNGVITYALKPYKIVFINENFYLACENPDENYLFTMLRIAQIESVIPHKQTFYHDYDIKEFIKHIQTPFSRYTPQFKNYLIKIVLKVEKPKAKFFRLKKHLPSQKILEELADGSLLISFEVTQELEVESLIKSWMPHMRVIEPQSLKEKIEADLRKYLNIETYGL